MYFQPFDLCFIPALALLTGLIFDKQLVVMIAVLLHKKNVKGAYYSVTCRISTVRASSSTVASVALALIMNTKIDSFPNAKREERSSS